MSKLPIPDWSQKRLNTKPTELVHERQTDGGIVHKGGDLIVGVTTPANNVANKMANKRDRKDYMREYMRARRSK